MAAPAVVKRRRHAAPRGLAAVLLVTLAVAGAATAFVGARPAAARPSPLIRGAVAKREVALVPLTDEANSGVKVEVNKFDAGSKVMVQSAMLPLGLLITQNENAFVVEDIRGGGAVALGEADVKVGDIVHAVSGESNGVKGMLPVSAFKSIDDLTEALMSNADGKAFVVIERNEEAASGGSPISWMFDVGRQF
mmetsp:Transcript_36294/g.107851  ORF Transcript_36294/g.107851 Transcript_36294/m.107851 type:complete len:193 (-) Transcript_36294:127-705(-)